MTQTVYLANSYPWLRRQLLRGVPPDPREAILVDAREEADLIVHLQTDKREPDRGDGLRDFNPRELRRVCVFSQLDEPFPWAPGAYASLPASYSRRGFVGGFYVAQHHHDAGGIADDLDAARDSEPDLLWSFVGTCSNHPVRTRLRELQDSRAIVRDTQTWSEEIRWTWKTEHKDQAREAFSGFAQVMGRSAFVACPRGRGAGSIRLFEAMRVGRAPVVISDDWLPPPFVDWDSCSVRIPERHAARLPAILREREPEAEELGRRARAAWERWYSPDRQLSTLIAACQLTVESAPSRPYLAARACLRGEALRGGARRLKEKVA